MWDLTVKIVRGVTLHPGHYSRSNPFSNCYPHEIEFADTKIMEIGNETKIMMLNGKGIRNFILSKLQKF